jgi:hypothetical protein
MLAEHQKSLRGESERVFSTMQAEGLDPRQVRDALVGVSKRFNTNPPPGSSPTFHEENADLMMSAKQREHLANVSRIVGSWASELDSGDFRGMMSGLNCYLRVGGQVDVGGKKVDPYSLGRGVHQATLALDPQFTNRTLAFKFQIGPENNLECVEFQLPSQKKLRFATPDEETAWGQYDVFRQFDTGRFSGDYSEGRRGQMVPDLLQLNTGANAANPTSGPVTAEAAAKLLPPIKAGAKRFLHLTGELSPGELGNIFQTGLLSHENIYSSVGKFREGALLSEGRNGTLGFAVVVDIPENMMSLDLSEPGNGFMTEYNNPDFVSAAGVSAYHRKIRPEFIVGAYDQVNNRWVPNPQARG